MLLTLSTAAVALLPSASRSGAAPCAIRSATAVRTDAPSMGLFDAFMQTPEQKAAAERRKEEDFQNQQEILRRQGPRHSSRSGALL
jgi:hypothetical protein